MLHPRLRARSLDRRAHPRGRVRARREPRRVRQGRHAALAPTTPALYTRSRVPKNGRSGDVSLRAAQRDADGHGSAALLEAASRAGRRGRAVRGAGRDGRRRDGHGVRRVRSHPRPQGGDQAASPGRRRRGSRRRGARPAAARSAGDGAYRSPERGHGLRGGRHRRRIRVPRDGNRGRGHGVRVAEEARARLARDRRPLLRGRRGTGRRAPRRGDPPRLQARERSRRGRRPTARDGLRPRSNPPRRGARRGLLGRGLGAGSAERALATVRRPGRDADAIRRGARHPGLHGPGAVRDRRRGRRPRRRLRVLRNAVQSPLRRAPFRGDHRPPDRGRDAGGPRAREPARHEGARAHPASAPARARGRSRPAPGGHSGASGRAAKGPSHRTAQAAARVCSGARDGGGRRGLGGKPGAADDRRRADVSGPITEARGSLG